MSDSTNNKASLLEARDLVLSSGAAFSFSADKGQVLWAHGNCEEIYDVLSGLVPPIKGEVIFQGFRWRELDPFAECRARAQIGRVFPHDKAWIENLSLRMNVGLRVLHAGFLTADQVNEEIALLAAIFDVTQHLDERPEGAAASVLERCQWVRAFLGTPSLLLFDNSDTVPGISHTVQLREQVSKYIASGGTLIWSGAEPPGDESDLGVPEIRRISIRDTNSREETCSDYE